MSMISFDRLKTGRTANAQTAALTFVSIFLCGCHQKIKEPSSVINVADPATAGQLLSGFYSIEQDSWRWVAHSFSVALKPPQDTRNGARLTVHLYFPDVVMSTEGTVTLSAAIDGKKLGSQRFSEPGRFDFVQELSAADIDTNILPVQFCFDKAMPPGDVDLRELAAVVTGISLEAGRQQ